MTDEQIWEVMHRCGYDLIEDRRLPTFARALVLEAQNEIKKSNDAANVLLKCLVREEQRCGWFVPDVLLMSEDKYGYCNRWLKNSMLMRNNCQKETQDEKQ